MPPSELDPRTNPSAFEEELAAVSAEDQRRLQETEELERMYEQDLEQQKNAQKQNSLQSQAANLVKDQLKKQALNQAKRMAASSTGSAIAAASPYIGTALLIFLAVSAALIVILASIAYSCQESAALRWGSKIVSTFNKVVSGAGFDVCGELAVLGMPNENPGTGTDNPNTDSTTTDQEARDYLARYGIKVNKLCDNPSREVGGDGQTCLQGTQLTTLDEIINFKFQCISWVTSTNRIGTCDVTVTGGSEPGHETGNCSHGLGYKIDIRPNSNIDAFIENTFTRQADRGTDKAYLNGNTGSYYVRESDHWDISVGCV